MRRMFARRTAGSAGRSAGAAEEWKNMPIEAQGTRCGTRRSAPRRVVRTWFAL
jgi:hypothetical protein